MAMENPEELGSVTTMDDSMTSCSDRSQQVSRTVKESENLGVDLLDDLDSYMQDINDRLTISRMVSDSVIRGMVGAVEGEAADRIAQKESEFSRLKERLLSYDVFAAENRVPECPSMFTVVGERAHSRSNLDISVKLLEHDSTKDILMHHKTEARKQLIELKERIHNIGRRNSINSTAPLEKVPERFTDIDRVVDFLQFLHDSFFNQMSNIVYLSRSSFSDWQHEREFQAEVEAMVISVYFRSFQQEFERMFWDQNSHLGVDESINFLKKRKEELFRLRQELDGFNKLLSVPDAGHITSHGSLESGEEWGSGGDSKVTDHLHRKLSGSHVFSSSPPWEANGKHEELTIAAAKLIHMTKEDLVDYFKTEIMEMKRNHESKVQEMTEEYFRLKREYLRERGSSLPPKKDKDLDELRRKIPEFILKLDELLVESDVVVPSLSSHAEYLNRMKERLDGLQSENSHLRDMLVDKTRESEHLSAEFSDASKKISCYSRAEANLLEVIGNLKHEKEEECIKSTISEEVYQCFLRMLPTDLCCINLCTDGKVIDEVSLREVVSDRNSSESEIENLYMESVISQELSGLLFVQALKEAKEEFDCLTNECVYQKVLRVSLEQEVLEKVELVKSKAVKNQRLKEEILQLVASVEEKGRLAEETGDQLAREKELFDQATGELERLRDETRQQAMRLAEISKESEAIKSDLDQALEKIEIYKEESCKLHQKHDFVIKELNQKEEEIKLLLLAAQEKQDKLSLVEVNESVYKKQMKSVVEVAEGIMKSLADLENRATVDITRNQSRLALLGSDLKSLSQSAMLLKKRGLAYKQRLEKRCLDLEKAENEVDLLGDEVDNLLSLLEKIYIALDHYSPVLKHYPGVMEILKLVKGELSGESEIPTKR